MYNEEYRPKFCIFFMEILGLNKNFVIPIQILSARIQAKSIKYN